MDELRLFVAPRVLGDQTAPGLFAGRSPATMDEALGLRLADLERSGDDAMMTYRPHR